jgi:hypothetical protein
LEEDDSGSNAGLQLDEDGVDEDLDEDFEQAVEDFEVSEDIEGEEDITDVGEPQITTKSPSVSGLLALDRSSASTIASPVASPTATPGSTPSPAPTTPWPRTSNKPSVVNLRKWAAEAEACWTEESVKKSWARKTTLAETATKVSKEIVATRNF